MLLRPADATMSNCTTNFPRKPDLQPKCEICGVGFGDWHYPLFSFHVFIGLFDLVLGFVYNCVCICFELSLV